METRERSPNYPAHSLEMAIKFASALYGAEKRSAVPMEVVAKALGSENLTGPSRSKIGAMRQFGLIEGRGRVRVSDLSLGILLHPSAEKYRHALQTAAWNPPLFHELHTESPDASDETLRYHLIKDRGFSTDGASRVIRAYRETVEFVKNAGVQAEERNDLPQDKFGGIPPIKGPVGMMIDQRTENSVSTPLTHLGFPMGEKVARLSIEGGRPTQTDIDDLIMYLERWKQRLPREDNPGATESGENDSVAEPE